MFSRQGGGMGRFFKTNKPVPLHQALLNLGS